MENANPPPTNNRPVLSAALRARAVQELRELQVILAFVNSLLESIEQFLNNFTNQPNETNMNNLESDNESVDTPLVSPFPHPDNDLDDGEVLNELSKYENVGTLRRERIINIFYWNDLAFQCMIGFRKFTAYLDPFLPMNIISLLEDIGEFIMSDMAEALMGEPFRKITKLKYDVDKGLVSFTKIFDTYIFRMPRTIPRLRNFNWSKVPPLLELSQHDLMSGLRHPYEKNKFMYKNCLNLGPEYQVDESMKEWLIRGYVSLRKVTLYLTRRSLEVLRKFHWTTLGGRSNQLSHVSSPLLSKPGEYKAHLLEDKQIPSVGVFDEVFSTWMAFGGNTRNLGSFGEETDKITNLHQIHEEVLFTERGDCVAGIKRCCHDLSSDNVRDQVTASGRGRLKEDLESST
ncbi:hypothetical protein Tco_1310260 [Tanacetum coccineum]